MSRVRDLAELTCKEIVELVTEYQSHALDAGDRARFEQHLFACTWCMTYLKQMDRTVAIVGELGRREPAEAAEALEPTDAASLGPLFRAHLQNKGPKKGGGE
jgi:hypothetical protein